MADEGLRKKQEEFEDQQLSALDISVDQTDIDKVLKEGKRIDMISDEVVAKINHDKTLKKILSSAFSKTFNKAQAAAIAAMEKDGEKTQAEKEKVARAKAFREAFRMVYGRFMFEHGPKITKDADGKPMIDAEGNPIIAEGDLEHKDGPFMKILDKVLGVKVDAKFGLKGRSELQAVVRRLREYINNRRSELIEMRNKIPKLEKEKKTLSEKKKVAERYLKDLKGVSEFADSIDKNVSEYVDLSPPNQELRKFEVEITDLENQLNLIEMRINVDKVSSTELIDFFSHDPNKVLSLSNDQLDSLYEKIQSDQYFARKLFGIGASTILDELSVKNGRKALQKIFHPDKFADAAKYSDEDIVKANTMSRLVNRAAEILTKAIQSGNVAPIDDPFAKRDSILNELTSKKTSKTTLQADLDGKKKENTDKFVETSILLEGFMDGIDSLRKNQNVTAKIKAICDDYIRSYEILRSRAPINDPAVLKSFFENQVRQVIAKLNDALNADVKAFNDVSRELQLKIDKYSLSGIEDVLEKAFGKQKTPDEMKALELKSQEAEAERKAIQEGYDLITGDDSKVSKDVHTKFIALKKVTDKKVKDASGADVPVPLTAKSLREGEALDVKMKEQKEEWGKIKELFADGKTAALNGSFLKLGEFSKAYEESRNNVVVNGVGSKNFDEALSLLSGQFAAYKTKYDKEPVKKYAGAEKSEAEIKMFELGPKVEYLKEVKAKSEKYKEKAEAFITELREYLIKCKKAFELSLPESDSFNQSTVKTNRDNLDNVNVSTGENIGNLGNVYSFLKFHLGTVLEHATLQQKSHEFGVKEGKEAKDKREDLEKAKALHAELKPLVDKIKKAADLGVDIKFKDPSKTAADMKVEFDSIKPEDADFDADVLVKFYENYFGQLLDTPEHRKELAEKFAKSLTGLENEVKDANKKLTLAKEAAEKCKDLTDPQAALKIVGVLVAEQFPKLSMTEQEKLAKLVLAGDVAKLQTEEGYEALAKRGSAEDLKLDVLENLAIKGKLIGFKYQEGDKEVQPFKGMKPENFKDWASIEKLFNLGQLNHKNGFFLMAALEIFDEKKSHGSEVGVVRSVQSLRVEDKLKFLLAKQLGVHERMHVAGVNKIINDAFKGQMEKVRPLVNAHFATYDNEWEKGGKGVKAHRIQLLKLKYEELNDKLRKGEIDRDVYEIKLKALMKESEEVDIAVKDVGFSQNSMLSGFWHSKYSQWVRDRGHDVGKYVGKKALRFGWGSVKGGVLGSLNAAGWLGLRGTSLGVGLAKWPTAILTGIGSGIFSIFRRGKWMDNVKKDVGNVMSTARGWQDAMKGKAKGVKILSPIGKQISGEWGKSKYEGSKYADRVKKKEEKRAEKLKVLEEKAKLKAVEISESPFIDLAEFKAKIIELDKILGTSTSFPEDKAKAGPEHKVEAKNEDAAHGKKDDNGHGHNEHGHKKAA